LLFMSNKAFIIKKNAFSHNHHILTQPSVLCCLYEACSRTTPSPNSTKPNRYYLGPYPSPNPKLSIPTYRHTVAARQSGGHRKTVRRHKTVRREHHKTVRRHKTVQRKHRKTVRLISFPTRWTVRPNFTGLSGGTIRPFVAPSRRRLACTPPQPYRYGPKRHCRDSCRPASPQSASWLPITTLLLLPPGGHDRHRADESPPIIHVHT
jgi:hypothetical protein